jgi:hypothetical protein
MNTNKVVEALQKVIDAVKEDESTSLNKSGRN